jgi:beta-glucosidase-like glycosyl hydrolase
VRYLKTVATAKHYFDYDLEGEQGGPTDRQNIDVNVSARDQTEYFMPSFQSAVQRGRTQSIMCS